MTHPWPLFDLRIRTERLELRPPKDEDALALLEVARQGVHDPAIMPFGVAWTDLKGAAFDHGFFQYLWRTRAAWASVDWKLPLVAVVGDRPVGIQEIRATDFATLRTVETGSWLGMAWHGQGIGTEMRAAVLHFAFEGLGAVAALSGALEDNVASRRVSEKLGYRPNGIDFVAPRGEAVRHQRYLLNRADFRADRWPARIENLDECRAMFGLPSPTDS